MVWLSLKNVIVKTQAEKTVPSPGSFLLTLAGDVLEMKGREKKRGRGEENREGECVDDQGEGEERRERGREWERLTDRLCYELGWIFPSWWLSPTFQGCGSLEEFNAVSFGITTFHARLPDTVRSVTSQEEQERGQSRYSDPVWETLAETELPQNADRIQGSPHHLQKPTF